jgi:acetylornithine deacetylase
VNPSLVPGGAGEADIAQAVADHLKKAGLDVEVDDVVPGRPNVVGVLEGRSPRHRGCDWDDRSIHAG